MWGSLIQLTAFVLLDRVSPIDVQRLVGIHRDNDFSNECVDASFFKSAHEWEKGRHGRGYCCLVTKLCLTLCHPVDCSPPGSSVHGISQASDHFLLQGTFPARDWTHVSCSGRQSLPLSHQGNPGMVKEKCCFFPTSLLFPRKSKYPRSNLRTDTSQFWVYFWS